MITFLKYFFFLLLLLFFQPPIADLAIADLTITSQRNNDIDFTMPFMKLGKIIVLVEI